MVLALTAGATRADASRWFDADDAIVTSDDATTSRQGASEFWLADASVAQFVVCQGLGMPEDDGFGFLSAAIISSESLLSGEDGGNTCAKLCPGSPDCSDATVYASFYYTIDEE